MFIAILNIYFPSGEKSNAATPAPIGNCSASDISGAYRGYLNSLASYEDDWRPYASKADALAAWVKLGGIRLKVLQAFDLVE